jgi:chromosome segregation ATPase
MKGLWILGGLVAAAAAIVFFLTRDSSADLERLYEEALRERTAIEQSLAECGDLVRWFADRKPTEKKKGELEELRRRFETLEKSADSARDDASRPRDERKKALVKLGDDFRELRRDVDDLRARLREMKKADGELAERIKRLGDVTRRLADARASSADPEFQQRAGDLLEEARKFRVMAETALKELSVRIVGPKVQFQSAVNELDDTMGRMDKLLGTLPAPPKTAEAPASSGR